MYKIEDIVDKVHCADCLEFMREIPNDSVDACVTDPPYELGFMGKAWDKQGVAYNVDLWREVLRVLKPGGHLLSFGGSRTYHRMACAIEDAGFEIRDQIMWVYGSGFPKSLNISKAVDKLQGNERKKIIEKTVIPENIFDKEIIIQEEKIVTKARSSSGNSALPTIGGKTIYKSWGLTKGTSEWEGWGTALKPAHEPIVVARKPLSEKTVAANVLKWGTGGLNIDGCRVGTPVNTIRPVGKSRIGTFQLNSKTSGQANMSRFPANFIHDGSVEVLELFPQTKSGTGMSKNKSGQGCWPHGSMEVSGYSDSGSAARFFYCAKTSKKERGGRQ